MNVAIVTDSNSGIFEEEGRMLDVHVIPMPVMIEGITSLSMWAWIHWNT